MPKANTIDFISDRLFPWQFLLIGVLFLVAGLATALIKPIISSVLIIVGGIIITGYRRIEFDQKKKEYRVYNSFFFLKYGKWDTYGSVVNIYVNSSNVSQRVATMRTNHRSTFKNIEYNAYIEIEDGSKVYLVGSKDKNRLFNKLASLSAFFQLPIIDNTI